MRTARTLLFLHPQNQTVGVGDNHENLLDIFLLHCLFSVQNKVYEFPIQLPLPGVFDHDEQSGKYMEAKASAMEVRGLP